MYFRNVLSYTGSGFQNLSGSHSNIGQVHRRALGWDGGIPHNSDRFPNRPPNDPDPESDPHSSSRRPRKGSPVKYILELWIEQNAQH